MIIKSLRIEIDLSDIIRIVQYNFPLEQLLYIFIQRFDYITKMIDIKREAIFLIESWAINYKILSIKPMLLNDIRISLSLKRLFNTNQLV